MAITASLPELDFALEQMSELLHSWGFKRIHGKIWTLLALSTRSLDAADLIGSLSISKALVSISIRELLEVRAVLDVGRSERGTRLYQANTNLQEIAFHVLKSREAKSFEQIQSALQRVREVAPESLRAQEISLDKVSDLSLTIKNGSESLVTLLSSLQILSEPSSEKPSTPALQTQAPDDSMHSYTLSKPEFEPS